MKKLVILLLTCFKSSAWQISLESRDVDYAKVYYIFHESAHAEQIGDLDYFARRCCVLLDHILKAQSTALNWAGKYSCAKTMLEREHLFSEVLVALGNRSEVNMALYISKDTFQALSQRLQSTLISTFPPGSTKRPTIDNDNSHMTTHFQEEELAVLENGSFGNRYYD